MEGVAIVQQLMATCGCAAQGCAGKSAARVLGFVGLMQGFIEVGGSRFQASQERPPGGGTVERGGRGVAVGFGVVAVLERGGRPEVVVGFGQVAGTAADAGHYARTFERRWRLIQLVQLVELRV